MRMRGTRHLIRGVGTVLLCLVALASSGCGGGGDGGGGTPPSASSVQLSGTVNTQELSALFTQNDVPLNTTIDQVSAQRVDGTQVTATASLTASLSASPVTAALTGGAFSLQVPSGSAYLLKARTADGTVLWAVTPVMTQNTQQVIDLSTTNQVSLIIASLGTNPLTNAQVNILRQQASQALTNTHERLVAAVRDLVNRALLTHSDFSPLTEMSSENLQNVGGGSLPHRSLGESIPFLVEIAKWSPL